MCSGRGATGCSADVFWRAAIVVAVALGSGCGAEAPAFPDVVTTDSAGIAVHTLTALPSWDDKAHRWGLELEWQLPTGSPSPGAAPLVYRPQGYTRLKDGTLVILDAGEPRLVHVAPEERRVLHRFGERGEGPGQILSSNALLWPADPQSIWVLDPGNQRLSRFGLGGELLEERRVQIPGGGGVAFLDPATHRPWFWKIFFEESEGPLVLRDSVGRLDPGAGLVDFVAPMEPRVASRRRNVDRPEILAPMSWFAPVGSAGVVSGRSDRGRFLHWAEDGELLGILRIPMERAPIPESEKQAVLDGFARVAGGSATSRRDVGEHYRLYSVMVGVADSVFALQQGALSTPAGEPRIGEHDFVLRVFSVRGAYEGALVLPSGVGPPFWFETGRLVATHRDSLGVATVVAYRLSKPPASGER